MAVDRLGELERRLATLERRRLSSLAIIAALVAALAAVSQRDGAQAQGGSEVRAPFSVVDARGRQIFTITQSGDRTRVQLLSGDNVTSIWSASPGDAMLFLGGPQSKGSARMAVNFAGPDAGPSLLLADTTDELLSVEKASVEISAPLIVSPKDLPALRVEPDLVTATGALHVRASKGGNRTSLAPTSLSVHGADGTSVAAMLGLDPSGKGRLVVGAPAGPRGVIGQPAEGGISFALFDAPGTAYRIGMVAAPQSSSELRMFSGKRQAELSVTPAGGSLHLFNDGGYAAASVDMTPAGNGKISLGNPAGDSIVEAGLSTDGVGVVRVGPRMGGPSGTASGPPRQLVGRK